MTASRIFMYLCAAFLAGIAASSLMTISQFFVLGSFVLGILLAPVFWRKNKKIVVLGLCLLIFAGGVYRHQMFERPRDNLDYYKNYYSAEEGQPNFFTKKISGFKSRLKTSLDSSLSPPQSALLGAMMLGERERLSYALKEKLNRSGTRHITAISGMHIPVT